MPNYADIMGRPEAEATIPENVIKEVIAATTNQSVVLANAKQVRLSTLKTKQPVMATLPDAYFVDGDTGLKQTTKAAFDSMTIQAEELAAIVPIPDAVAADSEINLFENVKPLLTEAIGKAIDSAVLFGVNKPASWGEAIIPGAIAAGNTVKTGTNADIAADVAALGGMLGSEGFEVTGFASEPGLQWQLIGLRGTNGQPIYSPSLSTSQPAGLYGLPINPVLNGSWDKTKASLVALDWTKVIIGVRQDITWQIFSEGVITDADGKVLLNLMQQDTKALRVVMRLGYQLANPVSRVTDKGFPAAVLAPAAAPAPQAFNKNK